jgi:cysteinyl-tRNA synthetase
MISLTNTLTRKKEPFTPLTPGEVKMYVCGPTVYGLTHVGNARPAVFFDVARRYLEYRGFKVTFVCNYTDVDDKIIDRARKEGKTSLQISEHFTEEYRKDMAALGVRPPNIAPKVTEHVPQIIAYIEGLIERGFAYAVADGEVFYAVRKFEGYGKLSGKIIDDLLTGVRIQPGELKRDPLDFSLWKPRKKEDEPAWESPWGLGRPGWHIECSAMATQYLGETFDIHGGGIDLVHPHHENEIAQSEGRTGKLFARVWLHNLLLNINNEKMSKSLGNIFTNRDFMAKYGAETLKFLLLSGHYRSSIDFSERNIRDAQAALHRFYSAAKKCEPLAKSSGLPPAPPTPEEKALIEFGDSFLPKFVESMDDDLNTAKVVGTVFEYVRLLNGYLDKKNFKMSSCALEIAKKFLHNKAEMGRILNLFHEEPLALLAQLRRGVLEERGLTAADIDAAIRERVMARQSKNFARADAIRDDLLAKGIQLMDNAQGTDWDICFTTNP